MPRQIETFKVPSCVAQGSSKIRSPRQLDLEKAFLPMRPSLSIPVLLLMIAPSPSGGGPGCWDGHRF